MQILRLLRSIVRNHHYNLFVSLCSTYVCIDYIENGMGEGNVDCVGIVYW